MSKPKSKISILSVPLNSRYEHTLWFKDQQAQTAYMLGQAVYTFNAYSFIRRSWGLQVGVPQEATEGWRYLTFVNSETGKRYYYFINSTEYVNDGSTMLNLEIDVMQTYMFDYDLRSCFIERMHTRSDNVGDNTIPEGLELGPYYNYHVFEMEATAEMGMLVLSAIDLVKFLLDRGATTSYMHEYNGVFSGLGVYAFDNPARLAGHLNVLEEEGKIDAIVAIWMYPKTLVTVKDVTGEPVDWEDAQWAAAPCMLVNGAKKLDTYLATYPFMESHIFEGYKPNNKKLYTHPFNLLYLTNNQGETAEYKFEHLRTTEMEGGADCYNFMAFGAISPDAAVKLCPVGYNTTGVKVNYDEGVTLGNFPPCAWDSDTYKVWLAQNYHQLRSQVITAGVTGAAGLVGGIAMAATGNFMGAAGGLATAYHSATSVAGVMAKVQDAQAQPPQAKGTFSTTVNVAAGRQTFTFVYKSLRREYAEAIDQYFDRYGYAYHRVETPTIHNRERYTYVKTMGCNPVGNVCNEDLLKIATIYDNGVTFWADHALVGYYGSNPTL